MKHEYIIEALKSLKRLNVDDSWLAQNRVLLKHHIQFHPAFIPQKSIRVVSWPILKFSLRPVMATLIAFAVIVGSGTSVVFASRNVLPTNPLYSVKLTAEKFEGLLIFDDVKKVQFVVNLAQKRLSELQQTLAKERGNVDKAVVDKVLKQYAHLMNQASRDIDKIAQTGSKGELLSAVATIESSQHREILVELQDDSESESEALAEAQNAAVETDKAALSALNEDEAAKKELAKKQANFQLDLLYHQIIEVDELFGEIKSLKGYLPLIEADQKLSASRRSLDEARRLYDREDYVGSAEIAAQGLQGVIEVKKELIKLFGAEPVN
ncbi:hypothetical protein C4553_00325 [Candidatus Parcubacteria bacterium]|nr:MAG: hypothetical protein C4553_00325 [Candidatus Parcubacteria bacterium]